MWDQGKGDIADLVFRPDRLNVEEVSASGSARVDPVDEVPRVHRRPRLRDPARSARMFGRVDERGDPAHPVPGADVVAVPYDFRRSIIEAAERLDAVVCAHLGDASEAERAGRVIVVGHSMGGLVARVWMGLLGRWPWCRALITLGTPHRGAPKALAWLVNGVPGRGGRAG